MSDAPSEASGASAAAPAPAKTAKGIAGWSKARVVNTLRVLNLLNGLLLILVGILIFIVASFTITFTTVTVSIYLVFFGALLSCLECNVGSCAPRFKANFGFMFSFLGRTLFILFCATLLYSLNYIAGWIVGTFTALSGLFNGYVICIHPAFRSGDLSMTGDPYGGYTGGDKEMMDYLKRNPEVASRATGALTSFAAANPEATMKLAAAAAGSGKSSAAPSAAAAGENPFQSK